MPVLIIGWSVYDKLPEEEQKEFALVERYRTDYFYECYEYENAKGNKNYEWSDRCFNSQEELLDFFGYEMIEDLNADAHLARTGFNVRNDLVQKYWVIYGFVKEGIKKGGVCRSRPLSQALIFVPVVL